jgi:O-acetyl-ADP-ribose deacetylase (regulator of RNase III)
VRLLPDWPSQRQLKVERQIGDRVLALVQGDITGFAADAIVNAANASLSGGGGVDGAIHRVGGPAIMTELRARHDGCQTGRAVATGAGRLPARWVVHAVGPIWRGGRNRERELLASAYRESLVIADDLGARSVALAAISCGVYGYPVREAAEVAITTVADHLARDTSLNRATFVLRSDDVFDAFQHSLQEFTPDTDS